MEEMKERVLAYLQEHPKGKRKFDDIKAGLNAVSAEDSVALNRAVDTLEKEYQIFRSPENQFETREQAGIEEGRISINRNGLGYLDLEGRDSIKIDARDQNTALNGDTVLVKAKPGQVYGQVIQVLARAKDHVIGTYQSNGRRLAFVPDDAKLQSHLIRMDLPGDFTPIDGMKILCTIEKYGTPLVLKYERSIGYKDDPGVDITSILLDHDIEAEFPQEVMDQVAGIPQEVLPSEMEGRHDLRDEDTVTIDGDDSKDFDDAVAVHREGDGWLLKVSIADVSHYVTSGSPLDQEALKRGCSTYVTDRVVPMLPHELSNGICSLNPHVDRLALTCEMKVAKDGTISDYDLYPSVINSTERMTYNNTNKILDGDPELTEKYAHLGDLFFDLRDCADAIRSARRAKGAIDFASNESEIKMDSVGHPYYVGPKERGHAEEMIEDCMIAANVSVANYLKWQEIPAVYRIHEEPQARRIENFVKTSELLGHKFVIGKKNIYPKEVQQYLNSIKDTPEYPVLSMMMLRCMQKARYDSHCVGHFGLAETEYLHFTSPIRRYPDLVVHRMLRKYAFEHCNDMEERKADEEKCQEFAEQASVRERLSTDAEFAADDMKKAEYMMDHVGEVFEGMIDSVTGYGFYVELPSTIEGLVHVSELGDDYYTFNPDRMEMVGQRSHRTYRVGMDVKVICLSASKETSSVDFGLIGKNGRIFSKKRDPKDRSEQRRRRRKANNERRSHARKKHR